MRLHPQAPNDYEQRRKLQNRAAQRRYRDRMRQSNTIRVDYQGFRIDGFQQYQLQNSRQDSSGSTAPMASSPGFCPRNQETEYERGISDIDWNLGGNSPPTDQQLKQYRVVNPAYFSHSADLADSHSTHDGYGEPQWDNAVVHAHQELPQIDSQPSQFRKYAEPPSHFLEELTDDPISSSERPIDVADLKFDVSLGREMAQSRQHADLRSLTALSSSEQLSSELPELTASLGIQMGRGELEQQHICQPPQTIDVAFQQKVENVVQELLRFYYVGLNLKLLQEDPELHSKLGALQQHFVATKVRPPLTSTGTLSSKGCGLSQQTNSNAWKAAGFQGAEVDRGRPGTAGPTRCLPSEAFR
ncbi:hypothetical protein ABEF95_001018 [Exophiala dermatitidis]